MKQSNWQRLPLRGGVLLVGVLTAIALWNIPVQTLEIPKQPKLKARISASDDRKMNRSPSVSALDKSTVGVQKQNAPFANFSTEARMKILEEVLKRRNDNDPRLDGELRNLNAEDKAGFRKRYRSLALERLNERGTILFLLGRNIENQEDFDFIKEVVSQPPCLSLLDCSKNVESRFDHDHHSGINQITLHYPQLTALQALAKVGSPFDKAAREFIEQQSKQGQTPVIQARALQLLGITR